MLVAGRRALLMLVVDSTLLALAGRVNAAVDGGRSPTAPARACGADLPGLMQTSMAFVTRYNWQMMEVRA